MSRVSFVVTCLLCLSLVGGCSGARPDSRMFEARASGPYRLSSGDRLRIIVYGQDALTNSYAVDGTGRIVMPLAGQVTARGMSTDELARSIEGKLRAGFLREPRVSVDVETYRPFFIMGEVTTAGQYPYINGMTIQHAVAVSGGFTPRADKNNVDLTRVIDGAPVTGTVPISSPLQPGDTITIRERFF